MIYQGLRERSNLVGKLQLWSESSAKEERRDAIKEAKTNISW